MKAVPRSPGLVRALADGVEVAPPVLVYDQAGNLVKSWGGPGKGYDWPDSNHGITVDHKGNVWLAANGQLWDATPLPEEPQANDKAP